MRNFLWRLVLRVFRPELREWEERQQQMKKLSPTASSLPPVQYPPASSCSRCGGYGFYHDWSDATFDCTGWVGPKKVQCDHKGT